MTVASDNMSANKRLEQAAQAVQTSDEAAFEAVFYRYYSRIVAVLQRLVGDTAEADDLALETFWRLYRRAPDAAGREHNLGGWLYRVATNLGLNAMRAGRRRHRYEEEAGRWEASATGGPDPQDALETAETRRRVRKVLSAMNPRQAQLLILRHSGLAYKEIAGAVAIAPGSVGTLLARAEQEFERLYVAEES